MSGPNIIVQTNAGKPLYCRYGDVDSISHVAATIQVITDSVPIHSIQTDCSVIAFMKARSLTLIAISSNPHYDDIAHLFSLLELTYSHLVFFISDRFQEALDISPGFDLNIMLGSFRKSLDTVLDRALPQRNCTPFQLSCGVEVHGIPSKVLFCDFTASNFSSYFSPHSAFI